MFAVKTREEIQPFCYEHLTEMMPYDEAAVAYVCPVWVWSAIIAYAVPTKNSRILPPEFIHVTMLSSLPVTC